jgi:hypothetical protein
VESSTEKKSKQHEEFGDVVPHLPLASSSREHGSLPLVFILRLAQCCRAMTCSPVIGGKVVDISYFTRF